MTWSGTLAGDVVDYPGEKGLRDVSGRREAAQDRRFKTRRSVMGISRTRRP